MILKNVSSYLLEENKLNYDHIYSILEYLSEKNIDYADIYLQSIYNESWFLEDKIIKKGSYNFNQGVGIRAVNNEKTGFAYTDQINLKTLQKSAKAARYISEENTNKKINLLKEKKFNQIYSTINPLNNMTSEEKINLLKQIDKSARNMDNRVKNVNAILSGTYENILIAATDGTLVADIRPMVRLYISVLVENDNKREKGNFGGGGRYNYEYFVKTQKQGESLAIYYAQEAVKMALINLFSIQAPSGAMPVVLGSGWPGVLIHEAIGHGLEGDFNRKGTSIFNKKIGKKVASNICTIVDDATLIGGRGSLSIDDEGIPGQYNILIENGILKKYMQDKINSKLMNVIPTGNGRRESYAHLPMPRMTNTYMLPGKSKPEEIISSVKNGIYAVNFGGGQVDITSGNFVFSTSEAYLIKNGKIDKPIKEVTLIGSSIEVMNQISMIGDDLEFDNGTGTCIKNNQSIPVSVGQPTLKINKLTVGGTIKQ